MLRDTALAASGLLVEKIGGPSVKPYQPPGVWDGSHDASNTRKYVQDHGDALYRRSLYTFWKRMATMPDMDTFDSPMRDAACTRRQRTDTPLQALVAMNEPLRLEASRKLAERVIHESLERRCPAGLSWADPARARLESEGKSGSAECASQDSVRPTPKTSAKAAQLLNVGESKVDRTIAGARTRLLDAGFERGPESGCGDEQMNSEEAIVRPRLLRRLTAKAIGLRSARTAALARRMATPRQLAGIFSAAWARRWDGPAWRPLMGDGLLAGRGACRRMQRCPVPNRCACRIFRPPQSGASTSSCPALRRRWICGTTSRDWPLSTTKICPTPFAATSR